MSTYPCVISSHHTDPSTAHVSLTRDTSDLASSRLRFQSLFDDALQDYEKQTGMKLIEHPLARSLENCGDVDDITALLQEQAGAFKEFRKHDDKLMKSLKSAVCALHAFSTNETLKKHIVSSFPPANAIFAGLAILLAAIKDVSASYDALLDLLESIESFLSRLSVYADFSFTMATAEIIVQIMVELLSTIALVTKEIKLRPPLKFVKKLLGENEIEAALRRLERLTKKESQMTAAQTLKAVCSIVQNMRVVMSDGKASTDGIMDALRIMQGIVDKVNESERRKLQQNAQKWLCPPEPWKNHNTAHESHHPGTLTWFFQHQTFTEWKWSSPNSLLWIQGKPGAGKSVLCSAIIEDIIDMRDHGLALLACFYCDFRDDGKKTLRGLVSSLLVQLCLQSNTFFTDLRDLYSKYDGGSRRPTDDALIQCLKDMLKHPGLAPVFIIIDALDECPNAIGTPSSREKVLKLIEELVGLHLPNLRICVTSRPEVDIKRVLDPLAFRHVSLHDEAGQIQDIVDYVRSTVNTDRNMERWRETDKMFVIEVLTGKAGGMFRWVSCQVDYLRRCLPSRVLHALEELPDTLDGTYQRALEDINVQNREYAHLLFRCVAVASRPLRVEELAEFLAFDFKAGPIPTFHACWRPEDPVRAVLVTCSSLLAVVKTEGSEVIQFSHFSVKEFLTSTRLAEPSNICSRYHVSMTSAHTIIAQACLGILLHLDAKVTRDDLKNFPLAKYAAKHWVDHARFENVSPNVQDGMRRLFDSSKVHLAVWVWIYDPEVPLPQFQRLEGPPRSGTYLHYASLCGLHDIVDFLVAKQNTSPQAFGRFSTPWYQLVVKGTVAVIWTLLGSIIRRSQPSPSRVVNFKYEARTGVQDEVSWAPLYWSSQKGNVELTRILLENNADARAQDEEKSTPLHVASQCGHVEVAHLLLDHGAVVGAQDEKMSTPLHVAAQFGHVEVTRLLLKYGAVVGAQEEKLLTPLHVTSQFGHVELTRLLLKHGAVVGAQDEKMSTPLHAASQFGHEDVTQLLLKYGAVVDAQDNTKSTPLHLALRASHTELARVLLKHNANVNAQDETKSTPLHLALRAGFLEFARALLERGADPSARDQNKWTPLHQALRLGYQDIPMVLLSYGADAGARDNYKTTPLHWASESGNVDVVRASLARGVNANVRDNHESTPLHLASQGGHVQVAQVLFEHGASASSQDKDISTPLHLASRSGHLDVALVLLEHGADVSAEDMHRANPLHWASEGGHVEVLRALLKHGAAVSAQDIHKVTPLHFSLRSNQLEAARVLLESGADPNIRDPLGLTPLHFALRSSQVEIARVLLECGADPNIRDPAGSTPLHRARILGFGRHSITQSLLDYGAVDDHTQ